MNRYTILLMAAVLATLGTWLLTLPERTLLVGASAFGLIGASLGMVIVVLNCWLQNIPITSGISLAGIRGRFSDSRVKASRVQAAREFNTQRARENNLHEWMCPHCNTISKGISHPTQHLSGLRFPACCERFCWHGPRMFHSDFIPDQAHTPQDPSEL